MMHSSDYDAIWRRAVAHLEQGFPDSARRLAGGGGGAATDLAGVEAVLLQLAERLRDNFPYHDPLYAGQMLKPPAPVAQLAYQLAMLLNPNNHALDGGRATSALEKECVAELAALCGLSGGLGHLCGGGTLANFEALWVARELAGAEVVFASEQAHYTHSRLSDVLRLSFRAIPVDERGRMDVVQLEAALPGDGRAVVVATLGTTGLGAVDPLHEIAELRSRREFRLHVDAAYGGYFRLADTLSPEAKAAFAALPLADSIAIDPHKHGLQPYGCGCVLFRDPSAARVYDHESPYTYFTSDELHLGRISLECSRPGAAAAALWATMQQFPLTRGGSFAAGLEAGRQAALRLAEWLRRRTDVAVIVDPELDIVVWALEGRTATESSARAREAFAAAAEKGLHLALFSAPRSLVERHGVIERWDEPHVTCLRSCLMKPEHREWLPEILVRLEDVLNEPLR